MTKPVSTSKRGSAEELPPRNLLGSSIRPREEPLPKLVVVPAKLVEGKETLARMAVEKHIRFEVKGEKDFMLDDQGASTLWR